MTFTWVAGRRREYSVLTMCRLLGVPRSGFYAWRQRSVSAAAARRAEPVARIGEVYAEVRARSGSPRVHSGSNARGVACCVNAVAKLMRGSGVLAKSARRSVSTSDSRRGLPVAGNALARDFSPAGPDTAWAMGFTYVPTLEGWLFLAVVVDLSSRRIARRAMAATMTSRLVADALGMAVARRCHRPGLVSNSDRGSQYASEHYRSESSRSGMTCSTSGVSRCRGDAVVEDTFGSQKQGLVRHEDYDTRAEARASLLECVKAFYNRARRLSTLGYVAPAD